MIDFYLFFVIDILIKDKNFMYVTPFISSQTSSKALINPVP